MKSEINFKFPQYEQQFKFKQIDRIIRLLIYNFYTISRMKLLSLLKDLVEMNDFFYSTQLLRFKKEGEYRTLTGGVLSIGIIVVIVVGFANMIMDTIKRNTFTTAFKSEKSPNPTLLTMEADPKKNFMFGVEIWRHNLNAPTRYFDVVAKLYTQEAGWANKTDLPLVQCTKEHWSQFPEVLKNFDKLQMGYWMCPPIGSSYDIYGKYSADHYQLIGFQVFPCNNATDPSRPCESQASIDALFAANYNSFYFTYYYMNSVVNPDSTDYIDYYLQDRNYVLFGPQIASDTILYMTDFTIESDNSIWPFESVKKDQGFLSQNLAVNHPFQYGTGSHYVGFYVEKSTDSHHYKRTVQKISEVFSFVGGIIGAGTAVLFFLNYYTDFSLEVIIASSLFKKKKEDPDLEPGSEQTSKQSEEPEGPQQKVTGNFFKFIKFGVFQFCSMIGVRKDWQDMEEIKEYKDEVVKQLDVETMLKRLIFLEHAITFLLDDFQLEGLQLQRPVTAQQIKKLRQRCNFVEEVNSDDSESQKSEEKRSKHEDICDSPKTMAASCNELKVQQTPPHLKSALKLKETQKRMAKKKHLEITFPDKEDAVKGQRFSAESSIIESIDLERMQYKQSKKQISRKRNSFLRDLELSKEEGNLLSQKIWNNLHSHSTKNKSFKKKQFLKKVSILQEYQ